MARKDRKQKVAKSGNQPVEVEAVEADILPTTEPDFPSEDMPTEEPIVSSIEVAVEDEQLSDAPQVETMGETDEEIPSYLEVPIEDEQLSDEELDIESMAEEIVEAVTAANQLYEETAVNEDSEDADEICFHISLPLKGFKKVLLVTDKFVLEGGSLPILGAVLIQAKTNGEIQMIGNDLDNVASLSVEGKVHLAGSVCIPHKVLFDIVRAMPNNATVEITATSRNKVNLVYGPLNTFIHGFDPDEMPLSPNYPTSPNFSFRVSTTTIARVSREVQPFVSQDLSRLILTGSYWKIEGGRLEVVAADIYRLAMLRQEFRSPIEVSFTTRGVVFEGVNQLVKGVEDIEEVGFAIEYNTKGNNLFIKVAELGYFVTKLLPGDYVNYQPLLESGSITHSLVAKRDEFLNRLKSAKVIGDAGDKSVRLKLNPAGNGEFLAEAEAVGHSSGTFAAAVSGEEYIFSVSASYLLQAVNAIDDTEICVEIGEKSPAIRISIPGNKSYTHLIMPMVYKPR